MSATSTTRKMTVPAFRSQKGQSKLVLLTAYSAPMAGLLAPHVDALLVGDSVGMVYHGLPSTVGVTMDMMILHTQAVRRGAPDSFVIADLPFASYQQSPQQAFASAAALLQQGQADAVKLEGGEEMAETVAFLTARGIPVMGHAGLLPQRINQLGSYKALGRDEATSGQILRDAQALEQAGAFSLVIEGVIADLAERTTASLEIPVIGIGASPACDGQILVSDDMLGLFSDFKPKFVRRYANLAQQISAAAQSYARDVQDGDFPSQAEIFQVKKS